MFYTSPFNRRTFGARSGHIRRTFGAYSGHIRGNIWDFRGTFGSVRPKTGHILVIFCSFRLGFLATPGHIRLSFLWHPGHEKFGCN